MSGPSFEGGTTATRPLVLALLVLALATGVGFWAVGHYRLGGAGAIGLVAAMFVGFFLSIAAFVPKVVFRIEDDAFVIRSRTPLFPRERVRRVEWSRVRSASHSAGVTNSINATIAVQLVGEETVTVVAEGATRDALQGFCAEIDKRAQG